MGVIFDMDGVLVDSYRTHFESWRTVAAKHGLRMSEEEFASTFGRTSREIIRQLWPGRFTDDQVAAFDGEKEAAYRDLLATSFPEMDGASDLIVALHDAGFLLAIGSSGPVENVKLVKRSLAASGCISATVHGGEVKHGKPDPEVFLAAARKLKLPPSQCAVVEDAPVGLDAARRAGMAAIGLTGTADVDALTQRAHLVVNSLHELSPERIGRVIADVPRLSAL